MVTEYESQNLPVMTDVPVMEDNLPLMEFLITMKEVLECMLGRRGDENLTPQMYMGTYVGNGKTNHRQIDVPFRPKYVRLFVTGGDVHGDISYERLDNKEKNIDWAGYSYRHDDTPTTEHKTTNTYGISEINDSGFTVYGGSSGGSRPNTLNEKYDWIAFG